MMGKFTFQKTTPLGYYLILLTCLPLNNQAQSVKRQCISSYGAIVTSENASFKQTIGQPYSTTAYQGSKVSILQGFQQPVTFKIETVNSTTLENLSLNVYPNPAQYSASIESKNIIEDALILVLDMNGKLLFSKQATKLLKYDINCAAWQNGTYIITVRDKNQNKSTLKLTINK